MKNGKIIKGLHEVHVNSLKEVNDYLSKNNLGSIHFKKEKLNIGNLFHNTISKMKQLGSDFRLVYVGEFDENISLKQLKNLEKFGFVYSTTQFYSGKLIVEFDLEDYFYNNLQDLAEDYCDEFISIKKSQSNDKKCKIYWGAQYLGSYDLEYYYENIFPELVQHIMEFHSPRTVHQIFIKKGYINKNRSESQTGTSRIRGVSNKTNEVLRVASEMGLSKEELLLELLKNE